MDILHKSHISKKYIMEGMIKKELLKQCVRCSQGLVVVVVVVVAVVVVVVKGVGVVVVVVVVVVGLVVAIY
ncbi:LOW QUALITY PROTEIN: hypothetical protein ElyMa_004008600 [Elysia marginata]|uniref:Transmembrane protein n=1 Tax=Elysia marginata TaxID=1093978 RepID=A0AAV4G0Z6_9GAST|nr:LOW QUALITY PROTEIN: hypothetical protein ElyMa_004008600 [Elysia marginata]